MRKNLMTLMTAAAVAAVVTACGGSSTPETTKAAETTAAAETKAEETAAEESKAAESAVEGGELVVSTFGLSANISEEEVYKPFEDEFNATIVPDLGGANDRYTKLAADSQSTIDVIELSQAMTAKGVAADLFEKVDPSQIENVSNLIPAAQKLAEEGAGFAYTINSIGIIYDPEAVGHELTSYDDLWGEDLKDMVAIPEITTTFGPSMVYMAGEHAGVPVTEDNGEAAFQALEELKPNLVKTYTKSADLINMFTSGEVSVALVGDFGVPTIMEANPNLVYYTPDGAYANFNTISVTKNCKNKELAYAYINYRLSEELQNKTSKALNEAPTNTKVKVDDETAKNMTYGETAEKAQVLDYTFVNPLLEQWIDQWNRTINN